MGSLPKENTVCFNIKFAWHNIYRMYNQKGAEYDLTTSIGFVLLNIDANEGSFATKIAPQLGMEPRSLSRMLKNLEEQGLIYRKYGEGDKRKVKIMLTDMGKEKREVAKRSVKRFNEEISRRIDPDKLDIFFEVIRDIGKIVESNEVFGRNGNIALSKHKNKLVVETR